MAYIYIFKKFEKVEKTGIISTKYSLRTTSVLTYLCVLYFRGIAQVLIGIHNSVLWQFLTVTHKVCILYSILCDVTLFYDVITFSMKSFLFICTSVMRLKSFSKDKGLSAKLGVERACLNFFNVCSLVSWRWNDRSL